MSFCNSTIAIFKLMQLWTLSPSRIWLRHVYAYSSTPCREFEWVLYQVTIKRYMSWTSWLPFFFKPCNMLESWSARVDEQTGRRPHWWGVSRVVPEADRAWLQNHAPFSFWPMSSKQEVYTLRHSRTSMMWPRSTCKWLGYLGTFLFISVIAKGLTSCENNACRAKNLFFLATTMLR